MTLNCLPKSIQCIGWIEIYLKQLRKMVEVASSQLNQL